MASLKRRMKFLEDNYNGCWKLWSIMLRIARYSVYNTPPQCVDPAVHPRSRFFIYILRHSASTPLTSSTPRPGERPHTHFVISDASIATHGSWKLHAFNESLRHDNTVLRNTYKISSWSIHSLSFTKNHPHHTHSSTSSKATIAQAYVPKTRTNLTTSNKQHACRISLQMGGTLSKQGFWLPASDLLSCLRSR